MSFMSSAASLQWMPKIMCTFYVGVAPEKSHQASTFSPLTICFYSFLVHWNYPSRMHQVRSPIWRCAFRRTSTWQLFCAWGFDSVLPVQLNDLKPKKAWETKIMWQKIWAHVRTYSIVGLNFHTINKCTGTTVISWAPKNLGWWRIKERRRRRRSRRKQQWQL